MHWSAHRLAALLLAIACLSATSLPLRALELGEPLFEAVGDSDTIPNNVVTALAEDQAGFIWVGTSDGLVRFDGYRFRFFDHQPSDHYSIGGDFVRCLMAARDGRLWVGSNADGLSVYDPALERFERFRHAEGDPASLVNDTVRSLAEAPDGRIWIGTRAGLDYWDPASRRLLHVPLRLGPATSANDDYIAALLVDRRGDLWVGSWNGLSRLRAGQTQFERVFAEQLADEQVQVLLQLDDGRIALGTARSGALLFDPAHPQQLQALTQRGTAAPGAVLAMLQAQAGELWLGAFGGIEIIDSSNLQLRQQIRPDPALASSLANDQVRAFLRDRSGQIWIGGYGGGLQRYDPSNRAVRMLRHSPSRPETLSAPSISSVLELTNGDIWIGTRGNGIDVLKRQSGVARGIRPQPDNPAGLRSGAVTALAQTIDGQVWAGTLEGLYQINPDNDSISAYGIEQGLPNTYIRRLLAAPDGGLWVGTDAGLAWWSQGKFTLLARADGQALREDVNALALATDGRLWVGTSGGLYTRASNASGLQPVRAKNPATALPHPGVLGLLLDRSGKLWIDTPAGLSWLKQWDGQSASFVEVSAGLGFAGQTFGANLLEDSRGRIWSQRFVLDPVSHSIYELGRADGADLGTPWFRSYAQTRDGLLLFGGSKGLLLIDPEQFQPWTYRPALVVTELKIDGQQLPASTATLGFALAPQQRGFSVEFSALDFTAPQRNRYAYRLEGFDQDWTTVDFSRRVASYTSLKPGTYTLQIRGSGRTGVLTDAQLSIPVIVQAAWWQTGWFLLLAIAFSAALIWLGTRLYSARIRRQAADLQAMVNQRTTELSTSKEKAELALQQLQTAQRELVAREKMVSLGQLVAGVAHEINTPVGIALTASSYLGDRSNSVLTQFNNGKLGRTELVEFMTQANEASTMIMANLQRAAELVRNFKQVSVDRSSDDRRRFNLAASLHAIVDSLRLTWKRRPVELTLDCPDDLELDSYPGALGQIITNLIQNALLHAFDEGQPGQMRIEASPSGNHVLLLFADNGAGIGSAELSRIFEPFFTTRRAQGGSGLGLHIVFNLVTVKLRGDIRVSSEPGAGMRFEMVLPRVVA